eukprot:jgi/Chlat1/8859/Chrsp91S08154
MSGCTANRPQISYACITTSSCLWRSSAATSLTPKHRASCASRSLGLPQLKRRRLLLLPQTPHTRRRSSSLSAAVTAAAVPDRRFEPVRVGRLLVRPPPRKQQFEQPIQDDLVHVTLAEGDAWGTGEHPTTQLCLDFLSNTITGGELVLDYGCGTGILSVAAILLGAEHAVAVDIAPEAVEATCRNARLNNLSDDNIRACFPEDFAAKGFMQAFDICVINMLLREQIRLAPDIAQAVKPGGLVCVSGLTADNDLDSAQAAYGKFFNIVDGETKCVPHPGTGVEWGRLVGVRNSCGIDDSAEALEALSESAL